MKTSATLCLAIAHTINEAEASVEDGLRGLAGACAAAFAALPDEHRERLFASWVKLTWDISLEMIEQEARKKAAH